MGGVRGWGRGALRRERRAACTRARTVDEAAEAEHAAHAHHPQRSDTAHATPHDALEEGLVLVPEALREGRQLAANAGVHLAEKLVVGLGKELEELVVRQVLDAHLLQLQERVLARVQVGGDDALRALEDHVQHIAAARREHEDCVIIVQVQQLTVNARVLPRHVVDDGAPNEREHHPVLQAAEEVLHPAHFARDRARGGRRAPRLLSVFVGCSEGSGRGGREITLAYVLCAIGGAREAADAAARGVRRAGGEDAARAAQRHAPAQTSTATRRRNMLFKGDRKYSRNCAARPAPPAADVHGGSHSARGPT